MSTIMIRGLAIAAGAAALFAVAGASSVRADDVEDARKLLGDGRLKDALEKARAAVAARPDDGEAHGVLSKVLFELRSFAEARTEVDRAAALDPEVWASYASGVAARIAFFYGKDDEARAALAKMDEPGAVTRDIPFLLDAPGLTKRRSKSGRYVVHVDAALAKTKGDEYVAAMMDLIYEAYSKVFSFEKDEALVSRVYVFGAASEYKAFYEKLGDDQSDASGFFDPSLRFLVVRADPEGAPVNAWGLTDKAIGTMFHEGFHQFIDLFAPNVPLWFNEGLAEYFGPSTVIGPKKLQTGVVPRTDPSGRYTRYERIIEGIKDKTPLAPLPLGEFLRQTDEQFGDGDADRKAMNYAQAWSFTHFLLHDKRLGKKGTELIKGYFTAVREGRTPEEALAQTFGKTDLDKLEKAWIDYVTKL